MLVVVLVLETPDRFAIRLSERSVDGGSAFRKKNRNQTKMQMEN